MWFWKQRFCTELRFVCFSSAAPSVDRLGRVASHLLQQRSFYPLLPPAEEMTTDTDLLLKHALMPYKPHMLVLPSELRFFVKVRFCRQSWIRIFVTSWALLVRSNNLCRLIYVANLDLKLVSVHTSSITSNISNPNPLDVSSNWKIVIILIFA